MIDPTSDFFAEDDSGTSTYAIRAANANARARTRAAIRLAAEHLRDAPPTDYGPDNSLHQAVAGIVLDLLDNLDDPHIRERLGALIREEARP
jgi:hypothetical protein